MAVLREPGEGVNKMSWRPRWEEEIRATYDQLTDGGLFLPFRLLAAAGEQDDSATGDAAVCGGEEVEPPAGGKNLTETKRRRGNY